MEDKIIKMKKIFLSLSFVLMISNLSFAQDKKSTNTLAANDVVEGTAAVKGKESINNDIDTKKMAFKFVNALGLNENYMNPFMTIISLKKEKYLGNNYSNERKKILMGEFEKNVKLVIDEKILDKIKNNQEINDYFFAVPSEK